MEVICKTTNCRFNSNNKCIKDTIEIGEFTYYDMNPYDSEWSTYCKSFKQK